MRKTDKGQKEMDTHEGDETPGSLPKERLFVACDVPAELVKQLVRFQADMHALVAETGIKVRWVQPHGIHLTLRFLGEVAAGVAPAIEDSLKKWVAAVDPFSLVVSGVGAFPGPKRARVLWVGLGRANGGGPVHQLHEAVEDALEDVGFPRENRPFQPHLTIARIAHAGGDTRALESILTRLNQSTLGSVSVDRVVLYQSVLKPAGAEYHARGYAFLGGGDGNR